MPSSIWKGSITFGLVNIPVELRAAVRADHIAFRLLDAESKTPVRYERVRQSDEEVVAWKDIVKGYEYTKGKFIVLTDEDFKAAALASSKTIDILDFVQESEIDPRFFETPYFLMPGKGGDTAYALLREVMRETGSVGIGKIIMRQNQHLVGVHVVDDALVLDIMRFANEIIDPAQYAFPKASVVKPREHEMAVQLVKSLTSTFEAAKYTDEYRENLMRIIKAKAKGKALTLEQPEKQGTDDKVLDLMSRLQESLRRGRGAGPSKARPAAHVPAKRAPKARAGNGTARRRRSA